MSAEIVLQAEHASSSTWGKYRFNLFSALFNPLTSNYCILALSVCIHYTAFPQASMQDGWNIKVLQKKTFSSVYSTRRIEY